MDQRSSQLLTTIQAQAPLRRWMTSLLGGTEDSPAVYYLTPLFNLKQIIRTGGIRPRYEVHDEIIDPSGEIVQSRRERSIVLGGSENRTAGASIHACVNFFLNPFNDTMFQFRRNTYLRGCEAKDYDAVLCILELDLRRLLELPNLFWSVSERNLASRYPLVTYDPKVFKQFDWKHIYSFRQTRQLDKFNDLRSAEFIAYIDSSGIHHIPSTCIRILTIVPG